MLSHPSCTVHQSESENQILSIFLLHLETSVIKLKHLVTLLSLQKDSLSRFCS